MAARPPGPQSIEWEGTPPMSTRDDDEQTPLDEGSQVTTATVAGNEPEAEEPAEGGEPPKRKLELDVEITDIGPCKKHLKVVIPQPEVNRQFEESLRTVRKEAAVPGFRPGRAPVSLVQKRFKKEVAGQVKSTLLLAALDQIDEEYKVNPISQPKLDLEAIDVPQDGPLTFEMDVEVQPDFELPEYKGLTIERSVRTVTEADTDEQLVRFLERYAQKVPKLEGGAAPGDLVTADLSFDKDGIALNQVKEVEFRLQPELRFQDGRVPNLDRALGGARPGDVREAEAQIGSSSPDPALRNQTIRVTFNVLDLKTYRLPEINAEFLATIGFDSEAELRRALREILERRLAFQQRQAVRRAILDQLVAKTPFDLPADLVARQERSTLRSQVLEMRQNGMSDTQIRAREAELRANAHEATLRSLKEFFILSKIAEAEDLSVDDDDIEQEIETIAARSDESPRRVRARVEKEGLGEALATQILERKAIDRILESVQYQEVALVEEKAVEVETLDSTLGPPSEPEGSGSAADESGDAPA
jgi:trigger factor